MLTTRSCTPSKMEELLIINNEFFKNNFAQKNSPVQLTDDPPVKMTHLSGWGGWKWAERSENSMLENVFPLLSFDSTFFTKNFSYLHAYPLSILPALRH
jgi:hypothetical protein